MKKNIFVSSLLASVLLSSQAFAIMDAKDLNLKGEYTQSIHVVNLLANTGVADTGMTATPISVKYYNGSDWPCWTTTLDFHQDTAVHAGPGLGCVAKITQVIVMPSMVAEKLKTYKGPASVEIDTTKYSTHLTIIQNQAPVFDTQNGLVTSSGSVTIQVMAD
jgi:hypothetical protein